MSELLKRRKKLSEPETRYYMAQIVDSLLYLHQNLVIHRDLKLGNLFIDSNMKVKVGDFGLATHLTHPDERRKTICGTPNYIAPEILEGKVGHSFEVDIWSTGVILYTLLIGKPPFESKDVKSTYKRILANSYAFPEHTPIASDAKHLIRKMLQVNDTSHRLRLFQCNHLPNRNFILFQGKPENRPSLQTIAGHPFFTRSTAYMPETLPESAMHECPRLVQMNDLVHTSSAFATKEDTLNENYFGVSGVKGVPSDARAHNNENDPALLNRMNRNPGVESDRLMVKKDENMPRTRSASASLRSTSSNIIGASNSASNLPTGATNAASATALQMLSANNNRGPSSRSQSTVPANSVAAAVHPTQMASSKTQSVASASSASTNPYPSSSAASSRHASRGHFNAPAPMTTTYTQKFDIYVDSKVQPVASVPSSGAVQPQVGRKRDAAQEEVDRRASARVKAMTTEPIHASSRFSNPAPAERRPQYEFEIDKMRNEFEHVQLADPRNQRMTSQPAMSTPPAAAAPVMREAWAWQDNDVFPASHAVLAPAAISTPPAVAVERQLQFDQPAQASESEPMCISTPQDQVISSKEAKPLGTLETMHDMLNNSFSVVDNPAMNAAGRNRYDTAEAAVSMSSLVAKVWVVRYVDYTSKYGLGFLFNTGSAGVYFNDSTKIVLSADGTVFQYTERKRRDSSMASEHSSQKHLINSYPPELQKKVTLLKHFRNYLVDQQRNSAGRPSEDQDGNDGMQGNPNLIKEGVISEGACTSVKFGPSSTRYNSLLENNYAVTEGCDSPLGMQVGDEDGEDLDMPFLKKWVRTKHAILFRMSNRTVQVVFYDRSEVLLSAEARVITYVSKLGQRSEHSLDDVLMTGTIHITKLLYHVSVCTQRYLIR